MAKPAACPAAKPAACPATERRPSRTALRLVGLVGFVALVAATGYKAASKPGRHVPAPDPKLRALPPPGPDDEERPATTAPPAAAASPVPSAEPEPAAEPKRVPAAKGATRRKPAGKTKRGAEPKAAARPKPKPRPVQPTLGGPPGQDEIEACINARRTRLRACADEAAQQGEFVRRGYARATLSPNGQLSNISVPGGRGVFADCVTRVISTLRCRQFRGSAVEVTYRLR